MTYEDHLLSRLERGEVLDDTPGWPFEVDEDAPPAHEEAPVARPHPAKATQPNPEALRPATGHQEGGA